MVPVSEATSSSGDIGLGDDVPCCLSADLRGDIDRGGGECFTCRLSGRGAKWVKRTGLAELVLSARKLSLVRETRGSVGGGNAPEASGPLAVSPESSTGLYEGSPLRGGGGGY